MTFNERLEWLKAQHEALITKKNEPIEGNGVYERYANPILTGDHAPLFWRYDLNEQTNPYLMERFGVHAAFNSGAIKWNGKYVLVVRVEGADRKSFFAVAESPNGVDNFRFWDRPITLPEYGEPATNVYDMRLTAHEDGWIYGIFCVERKDPDAAPGDLSSAVAAAGVARTKDLVNWERLPDMESKSQQRNVVLHPEFVDGKYALYTRPQVDSSMRATAVASAGHWLTVWKKWSSQKRRSSTTVSITPSRSARTEKARIRSRLTADGCTLLTEYAAALQVFVMSFICI